MTQYHLHLKGYVGGSDFNSDMVTATLRSNPDTEVSVLIDSTGGQLSTALSIYAAFRSHGNVHAHFVGMNASAATIASLGAKRITMDASALYLVHKCSMAVFEWTNMNADELQEYITTLLKQKTNLDKLDSHVAAMYAARCGNPQAELLALMKTGGWLTSKEALEWGFIDEVTELEGDEKPELTEALVHAMAEAQMPIPAIPYGIKRHSEQHGEPLFSRFMAAIASLFKSSVADSLSDKPDANTDNTPTNSIHTSTFNLPTQMKHYPHIEAALKVQGGFISDADGHVSVTDVQLQAIEDALRSRRDSITSLQGQVDTLTSQNTDLSTSNVELQTLAAELKEQVKALKNTPAAQSPSVVNAQANTGQQPTATEDYFAHIDRAKELFSLVGG